MDVVGNGEVGNGHVGNGVVGNGEVGQRLVDAGWQAGQDQYRVVGLAAEFADSNEWALAGYSSAGRWIAAMLDIARRTANEWIRVGHTLRVLPVTSAALESRLISFSKAKVLTRTATPDTETELVELAQTVRASDLTKAIAGWSQQFEAEEVIDARQQQARSLTWQTGADGMVLAIFRAQPADGAVLMSAVDAIVMRGSQRSRRNQDAGVWPSLAQQRADALIEALTGGGAGIETEVVVHVRGERATLDDGTPITSNAVARLLPEAFVRALIHDANGRPINASARRRYPTARQRRVVKERDRACVDCGSHELLEYDHVPDFTESGHTVVEELRLRCGPCHRARHRRAS